MRYFALACDYDGTLALHGVVDENTVEALQRLKTSGRKLLLVTGRELEDLLQVFPQTSMFDMVVAENGGLLYRPDTREIRQLSSSPPPQLIELLRRKQVTPLSIGRVIVATREPYETVVLQAIHELGLEYQIIFNKDAVMVLPSGVNKATGLKAALKELGLSRHNVAAVGDAENDHAMLDFCEFSAAVANALPSLKEHVDWVTPADHGAGVTELIDRLIEEETQKLEPRPGRGEVVLGVSADGREVRLPAYGSSILLAGTSGGGKSSLVTGFVERLLDGGYQVCIFDPEGDYPELERTIVMGDSQRVPAREEVMRALEKPNASVVVNLTGLNLDDRPRYFQRLLPDVLELRTRNGRPHWVIVDEAHHVMPVSWKPSVEIVPPVLKGLLLVTVHPDHVSPSLLRSVDLVMAVGKTPEATFSEFAKAINRAKPEVDSAALDSGDALGWRVQDDGRPFRFRAIPARSVRRRHVRKYMEGELPPERNFYFRGPENKLQLRAQNLQMFLQLADGVDHDTWMHHLHQQHYSRWFREMIKDESLAAAAEVVERTPGLSPEESKNRVRSAIEERYTAAE
ncbi:MAG TPA: HAD family hydrolase [Clostridia bacterium]|nr:HAD family hydrolase [Clostridia bacterium]